MPLLKGATLNGARTNAMNHSIVYLNGTFVPADQARVSVFDHSFLYGDGCFETLIVRRGKPFRLHDHIDRLWRTTHVLGMRIPLKKDELAHAFEETVRRNDLADAYARITVTRGEGYASSDPRLCERPTLVIFAYDLASHPAERFGAKGHGLRCIVVSTRRIPPVCLDARIKANNYINMVLARMEAIAGGADEAIMLDINNFVAECPSRNIFIVRNGALETPRDHNVLNGITRQTVIDIAEAESRSVRKTDLTPYDLYNADELFACSTGGGIKAIVDVDGRLVGNGQVGSITRHFIEQYERALTESGA